MKILIVHAKKPDSFLGGIETYEKNLIENLKNHDLFISFPDINTKKKKINKKLTFIPYKDPQIPKEKKYEAINLHIDNFKEAMDAEIKKYGDFDLIICLHSIFPNVCTEISKAKIIFVLPSLNKIYFDKIKQKISTPERKWWKQILTIEKEIFSNKNIRIVVLSKMIFRLIKENYPNQKNYLKVISPGINKYTHGKNFKKIDALSVCRLSEEKNITSLIRVAMKIRHRFFYIVGNGPELDSLKNMIKYHHLTNVILLGAKKNPLPYYQKSRVFVLTSKYESFGLVLLEAMMAGIPCIAFAPDNKKIKTASDEIITNGKNGFLVKTEKEMSEKIDLLLSNEKLRKKMSESAIKNAMKYSWEKCCKEILKFANQ